MADNVLKAYEAAKEKGDYVAMSNIARTQGYADYDYTYSGIITEIPYECKKISGMLYLCKNEAVKSGIINAGAQTVGSNDYIIKDGRTNKKNPAVKIYASYRAGLPQITAIVDALLVYNEKQDPTDWAKTRTRKGLISEWVMHNALWQLNIQRKHAVDVDLDNNEYRFMR